MQLHPGCSERQAVHLEVVSKTFNSIYTYARETIMSVVLKPDDLGTEVAEHNVLIKATTCLGCVGQYCSPLPFAKHESAQK